MNIEDRVYCSRMSLVEYVLSMNIEDRGNCSRLNTEEYISSIMAEKYVLTLFLLNNSKSIGLRLLKFLTFPKYPKPSL